MKLQLSIIIPCYNCEKTLREAVASCFAQDLSIDEFEIVMVDDGSSDDTRTLMERLATERPNIRLIFHEINKGGGAARNTGIKAAAGKIIYCLDSDNVFAPNSVRPMLDYMDEKKVDGVAFYERRFFFGTNLKRYNTHINTAKEIITLIDLFNKSNTLLDNFFFTKESYLKTAGYPEHHGFDTQSFEMRYLLVGNTVSVCPNSIFYHRQAMQEKSYFERVHASGMFSVNFMLIFEDIFHLFTPEIQKILITFPLFKQNKSYGENILDTLKKKVKNGENIFIPNYTLFLIENGRTKWINESSDTDNPYRQLVQVFSDLTNNEYKIAQEHLTSHIEKNKLLTSYLEFLSLRILHGIAGIPYADSIKRTIADTTALQITPLSTRGSIITNWLRKHQSLYQTVKYFKKIIR